MEEKKAIKVRLSTVVIVILIIVTGVMAYFLYTAYKDKNDALATVEKLQKEIGNLKQEIISSNNTNISNNVANNREVLESKKTDEKTYTYENISGTYDANIKAEGLAEDAFYGLDLYENGIYKYEYGVMAPSGTIGNYKIEGNKIILNELFATASDVSTRVIKENKTITLTINEDGSLTDKNCVIEVFDENIRKQLNNVNLKKQTSKKLDNNSINKYFDGTYFVNSYSEN